MKNYLIWCVGLMLLLVGSASVAQTPDGLTPAEETVCDILQEPWVTPGLFGLCVAYCEAHDADLYDPEARCSTADARILAQYNKRKTAGDPEMPCLRHPCKCWSEEDLPAKPEKAYCVVSNPGNEECFAVELMAYPPGWFRVVDQSYKGYGYCQYGDNPAVEFANAKERDACKDSLEAYISAQGYVCQERLMKCLDPPKEPPDQKQ